MKIIRKMFVTISIIILILTSFGGNKAFAVSQDTVGLTVVQAAISYMQQYGSETLYSTADYNRGQTVFYQKKTNGRFGYGYYLDCASFVQLAFIRGISIEKHYPKYNDPSGAYTGFNPSATTPSGQIDIPPFEVVKGGVNSVKPGDVVMTRHANGYGHVMLYTGDGYVIHCDGNGYGKGQGGISWEPLETYASRNGENLSNYSVYRYSGDDAERVDESDIQKPPTEVIKVIKDWIYKKVPFRVENESNIDKDKTFEYQGIAKLESQTTTDLDQKKDENSWRFPVISDLIEWILNFICTTIKSVFVGFATLVQVLVTYYIDAASGEDVSSRLSDGMMAYFSSGGLKEDISNSITLEKIVYNKVPLLDVDVFNGNVAGGKTVDSSSLVVVIRNVVASLYMAIRKVSIIALLIVLLYYGVKFVISGVAEQKAEYKQKLLNWGIAFFIVFGLHYFLILVMKLNEILVNLLSSVGANVASKLSDGQYYDLANAMRELTYQTGVVKSILSTCLYMAMVYYLVKFIIIYFKRLFVTVILILLAPFMGIKFAVDRLKFKQSSSFTTWAKEYIFSVGTQTIHALVYTIFIGITYKLALQVDTARMAICILAFMFFRFMTEAEKMLRKFLKLAGGTADSIMGDAKSTDIKDLIGWTAVAKMHKYTKKMAVPDILKKKYETSKQFMSHHFENEYVKMKRNEYIDKYYDVYRPNAQGKRIELNSDIDDQIADVIKADFRHRIDKAVNIAQKSKKTATGVGRIMVGIPVTVVEDGLASVLVVTGGYTLLKSLGGAITGYRTVTKVANYRAKNGTYQHLQTWVNTNATSKVAKELRKQYLYEKDDVTAENQQQLALLHQARKVEVDMQYEVAEQKEKLLKGADGAEPTTKIQKQLAETYTKKLRKSVEDAMNTVERKDIQKQVKDYMKKNNKYALTMKDFELIAENLEVKTPKGEAVDGLLDIEGLTENIKKETMAKFVSEITEHDGIGNQITLDPEVIDKVENNIKEKMDNTTDENEKHSLLTAIKCVKDKKHEIEGREKINVFSNLNPEEKQKVKGIIEDATDEKSIEKQVTRLNRDQIIDTMKKAVNREGSIKKENPAYEIEEFKPIIKQAEKLRDLNEIAVENGEKPIYKDVGQLVENMIKNTDVRLNKKS